MSRVEPRVRALEALYAADTTEAPAPDVSGLGRRAATLAAGTWAHRHELDAELNAAASGWRVERMAAVDRSILRLALYELRHTEIPVGVAISEAVELAKTFGTARSGSFVNGVLGALVERPVDAEGTAGAGGTKHEE